MACQAPHTRSLGDLCACSEPAEGPSHSRQRNEKWPSPLQLDANLCGLSLKRQQRHPTFGLWRRQLSSMCY